MLLLNDARIFGRLYLTHPAETAFPIFKVSRFVRVRTDLYHNGHNKMIFAVSYV